VQCHFRRLCSIQKKISKNVNGVAWQSNYGTFQVDSIPSHLLVLVSFRKNLEQVDDTASKRMSEGKQRSTSNNTPRTFPVVSFLERFERVLVKQETCPSWMRFGNHCISHEQ
jgi:hypothetical protein